MAEVKWLTVDLLTREHAKYCVTYIQEKVHPVTASISAKFWEIKEDIAISKRTTCHFRISHTVLEIFAWIVDLSLT